MINCLMGYGSTKEYLVSMKAHIYMYVYVNTHTHDSLLIGASRFEEFVVRFKDSDITIGASQNLLIKECISRQCL